MNLVDLSLRRTKLSLSELLGKQTVTPQMITTLRMGNLPTLYGNLKNSWRIVRDLLRSSNVNLVHLGKKKEKRVILEEVC